MGTLHSHGIDSAHAEGAHEAAVVVEPVGVSLTGTWVANTMAITAQLVTNRNRAFRAAGLDADVIASHLQALGIRDDAWAYNSGARFHSKSKQGSGKSGKIMSRSHTTPQVMLFVETALLIRRASFVTTTVCTALPGGNQLSGGTRWGFDRASPLEVSNRYSLHAIRVGHSQGSDS